VPTDHPDLAAELSCAKQEIVELKAELEAANKLLVSFKAMLFGSRSEKASIVLDAQERLDLGDLGPVAHHEPANDDSPTQRTTRKARRNIGGLPKHFPRVTHVVEPESTQCACCQGDMHRIGEDVSEVLDIVPAILRVISTVRPICLPPMRNRCRPGAGAATAGRWRHGEHILHRLDRDAAFCLVPAHLPTGTDACWTWHQD